MIARPRLLYMCSNASQAVKVIWTNHAQERQTEWEEKLGVTRQEVENVVSYPEQIVSGDREIQVAQARRGNGLLRVPFIEGEDGRRVITVYWTSKVERYWKGEQDEDSV